MNIALYVHIPFCKHICPYCDFNKYSVKNIPAKEYVNSLIKEYEHYNNIYNFNINSLYLGGGTPTALPQDQLIRLLEYFYKDNIEITIEANPEDLDEDYFTNLTPYINRLSLGVQSLNDNNLKFLGRKHNKSQLIKLIELFIKHDFDNYNLDFIYSLPKQNVADIEDELKNYLSLTPKHISTYSLTIEQGTPFNKAYQNQLFTLPPQEEQAEQYLFIKEYLESNNYKHYEISNYALNDYESKHNLNYWNWNNYLGIGAGAHSFIKPKRWSNVLNYNDYIQASPEDKQNSSNLLNENELAYDFIFNQMRKINGYNTSNFNKLFTNLIETHDNIVSNLVDLDLIIYKNGSVTLEPSKLLVLDSILEHYCELI